jgi:hypothetical protein
VSRINPVRFHKLTKGDNPAPAPLVQALSDPLPRLTMAQSRHTQYVAVPAIAETFAADIAPLRLA